MEHLLMGRKAPYFIPRKIRWRKGRADASLSKNEELLFQWFSDSSYGNPNWMLLMFHGGQTDQQEFSSLPELKCFIIRFIYNISETYRIPSELLAEACLGYKDEKLWVDSWIELKDSQDLSDGRYSVVAEILLEKPRNRHIRHPEYIFKPKSSEDFVREQVATVSNPYKDYSGKQTYFDGQWMSKAEARMRRKALFTPKPEISDEECYFILSVGKQDSDA